MAEDTLVCNFDDCGMSTAEGKFRDGNPDLQAEIRELRYFRMMEWKFFILLI